jgi:hypothetical protein
VPIVVQELAGTTTSVRIRFLFPVQDHVAEYAALSAEASDEAGVFASYQEHALKSVPGTISAVNNVIANMPSASVIFDNLRQHLEKYRRRIDLDFKLASKLKLYGTPVYILCKLGEQPRFVTYLEIARLE